MWAQSTSGGAGDKRLRSTTCTISHAYVLEPQYKLWTPRLRWTSLIAVPSVYYYTSVLEKHCVDLIGRGQQKLHIWSFSRTHFYVLLPLTYFNLYLFPVISHTCEYKSFQWVLSLSSKLWELRVVLGTPQLAIGIGSECDFVWTLSSNLIVAYFL